jgi:membrane protein YqaA with SNARE-associated domain
MGDSSIPEAADAREVRLLRHERLSLTGWFVPFALLMALVGGVYLLGGEGTAAAGYAGLFAYLSVACTFLPLPTAWIVIWAAAPTEGGGLGLDPWIVATVGAAGTAVANMHDYYLVTFLYRYQPVRRIRATALYRRFAAWYNRAPFGTLAAASFLPIPVDVVRLLAISEGYNRAKFALGSLVGRWPRYLLFAILADAFKLGWQWVVGVLGATVCLGLWRGLPPLLRRLRGRGRAGADEKEAKEEEVSA